MGVIAAVVVAGVLLGQQYIGASTTFDRLFLLCPGFDLPARWPLLIGHDQMERWERERVLGIEDGVRPEQQGGEYLLPVPAHGLKTMSMGYLVTENTPMVWRGPMAGGALAQLLEQTLC